MNQRETREKLAEYAHNAWATWMKYMFEKSKYNVRYGTYTIPSDLTSRWIRQSRTSYSKISEKEKASDRAEADKILEIVKENKDDT